MATSASPRREVRRRRGEREKGRGRRGEGCERGRERGREGGGGEGGGGEGKRGDRGEGRRGGRGERKEVRERRGERKGHIKIKPLYRRVRMVAAHFDCCFTCSTSSSTTLCSVQIRSIGAERVS